MFNQDSFIYYRLLIDLSPSIFIICDFGTILSSMASANAPPPSLLCHPPTSNCEHNIVECILYLFSNTSNISCCSMLLVLTNSHSSRIRRSHFSYCLILFLYVPCILDSSNSDNKSGSRIYLTFSPLLHASTPSAHPIYDFPAPPSLLLLKHFRVSLYIHLLLGLISALYQDVCLRNI